MRSARYASQEAEHGETAYVSADEDAASELTPYPSPGASSYHHSALEFLLPVVQNRLSHDWKKQASSQDSLLRQKGAL